MRSAALALLGLAASVWLAQGTAAQNAPSRAQHNSSLPHNNCLLRNNCLQPKEVPLYRGLRPDIDSRHRKIYLPMFYVDRNPASRLDQFQ